MKRILSIHVFLFFVLTCQAQSSVLADGVWFKLGVVADGIYKIDRTAIENIFPNTDDFDPRTLKIYGNGPGILPQSNDAARAFDLLENAVLRVGTEDGFFDSQDYILFFAYGPDLRTLENNAFFFEDNIYSDTAFYFITYGGAEGKSLQKQEVLTGVYPEINTYNNLQSYEVNQRNILKSGLSRGGSGREWYGESFQLNVALERSFQFEVPGFTGNGEIILSTLGQSEGPSSFTITANNRTLGDQELDEILPIGTSPYSDRGKHHSDTFQLTTSPAEAIEINLRFNRWEGGSSLARLDKLLINAESELSLNTNQLIFRSDESLDHAISTFQVRGGSSQTRLWNVTHIANPMEMNLTVIGNQVEFSDVSTALQTYVAFEGSDFDTPLFVGEIENQNLKSLSPRDGIIITHGNFLDAAWELATFHEEHDFMNLEVIDVSKIYNEFSSGRQDVTALRDAIRFFWEKSPDFRYVLLFGDCSYDYKNRIEDNTNFVPTYQARNSLHPIFSYSSDDYFGFMDEEEGVWPENRQGDHRLDIGIGRIPVRTTEEADDVVRKIIRYSTANATLGDWKNDITYVVDDGDGNIHVADAEDLSGFFETSQSQLLTEKIYLDAFQQDVEPSRESSPAVTQQINSAIGEGTFLVNYIGHGNEFQWMDENVLNLESLQGFKNRFRLPIFVTATCQFGRYDDPDFFSGSEQLLLNPNGGAIALLTTTRPVFASSNKLVNEAFHTSLFQKEDGEYLRLGDIIQITKNESLRGVDNRNFSLLGDPFLQLDYPDYEATINTINGKTVSSSADTLSALEEITLEGEIINNGDRVTNFNGKVKITLLDASIAIPTLGQESNPFFYQSQENELFRGEASVTDGLFSLTFQVTRNTSYRFDRGKINLYAMDEENGFDASGSLQNLLLGGTAPDVFEDTSAPEINLYINDTGFRDGASVPPNSVLIASIEDETGINISTNGINQNITLTLNDENPTVINDHFTATLNDATRGFIRYPLSMLSPGRYEATIKLWDLYNNSSSASVIFTVSDEISINLSNIRNFPNPARTETTFAFAHDRLGEELEVTIQVFNSTGALVGDLFYQVDNSPDFIDNLTWNLEAISLQAGLYLYRINVRSTLDGARGSVFGRLVVN